MNTLLVSGTVIAARYDADHELGVYEDPGAGCAASDSMCGALTYAPGAEAAVRS
jgi:hypothetical protein